MEEVSAPELSVEEVWSGAEGPPSIADLALEQKGIYYPVVQHHWLLTSLLHAAMAFKVKAKPLSLFDSKVGRRPHFKLRAEISTSVAHSRQKASHCACVPSSG